MLRREFVAGGLSAATLLLPRLAMGKGLNRAAVVIGVDHPVGLPKLNAAASGAKDVHAWLIAEGFDAKLFTDADNKTVSRNDVYGAVSALVSRHNLDQLLVYFAGHGFTKEYGEVWLLSSAPDDPNDAIGVGGSIIRALQSGIPHVIFISDCCRSTAQSLGVEMVQGDSAFPNPRSQPATDTDVDVFYATSVGFPAWEVPVDVSKNQYEGVFTATLLRAFREPEAGLPEIIDRGKVITNASLKPFLLREVPARAQKAHITLTQRPHIEVTSGNKSYIAHVTGKLPGKGGVNSVIPTATLSLLSSETLLQLRDFNPTSSHPGVLLSDDLKQLSNDSGFGQATQHILGAQATTELELGVDSGFVVFGRSVRHVMAPFGVRVITREASGQTRIAVSNMSRAVAVAIRFDDGSGCILAALYAFVGMVVIDEQGVANVSYEPTRINPWRSEYDQQREKLALLRATVATSAKYGVFQIEGGRRNSKGAADMADRIRVLKAIDCTLGVYAAYAYANAGLISGVRSVNDNLRSEYGVSFFDVALLADLMPKDAEGQSRLVPMCPMLSQGWSLLQAKNVKLHERLEAARNDLTPALWTTFKPRGMDLIEGSFLDIFPPGRSPV